MDDVLKRLLATESRAEAIIAAAEAERQRLVEAALDKVRQAEARFQAEAPGRRQPWLHEAEERAGQTVADLTRKYEARRRSLREQADHNEATALAAALALLLDPEQ
jgi:V/A-type H+/Na+-transporting ATPase subunit G/H